MSPVTPETLERANNPDNKRLTHRILDHMKQLAVLHVIKRHSGDTESNSEGWCNIVKQEKTWKIVANQQCGGYLKLMIRARLVGDLLLFIDAPESPADAYNFFELISQDLKDLFSEYLKIQNMFALRTAVLIMGGATGERVIYCLRASDTMAQEDADILELMGPEETARGAALVAETVEQMDARCVVRVERERALCILAVKKMEAFYVRDAASHKKAQVKKQKSLERVSAQNRELSEANERGKFCLEGAGVRVSAARACQYLSECDSRHWSMANQEAQAAQLRCEDTIREERAGRERAEALVSDAQAGKQRADALTSDAQAGQQRSDALARDAQTGQQRSDALARDAQTGQQIADSLAREAQAGQQRANRRIRQLEDENEALRAEKRAWTSQLPRAGASLDTPCPHTPPPSPPPVGLIRAAKRILGMGHKQPSKE